MQKDEGCSLLSDTHFVLYSKRVVTPDGIGPYAGKCSIPPTTTSRVYFSYTK